MVAVEVYGVDGIAAKAVLLGHGESGIAVAERQSVAVLYADGERLGLERYGLLGVEVLFAFILLQRLPVIGVVDVTFVGAYVHPVVLALQSVHLAQRVGAQV